MFAVPDDMVVLSDNAIVVWLREEAGTVTVRGLGAAPVHPPAEGTAV